MFENDKYIVLDHRYMNTGGGCMVSTFTVYTRVGRRTSFINVNDEGCTRTTYDYILFGDFENVSMSWGYVMADYTWDDFAIDSYLATAEPEKYELYKYCQFEHYKKTYSVDHCNTPIPVNWLPASLYNTLTTRCAEWHKTNGAFIETNGTKVWPNFHYPYDTYDVRRLGHGVYMDLEEDRIFYDAKDSAEPEDMIDYRTGEIYRVVATCSDQDGVYCTITNDW